jgi:uncharacterized protein
MAIQPVDTYVTTASGVRLHFLDPKPEEIILSDIARGLSMSCRWSGQIGEHSPLIKRYRSGELVHPHWKHFMPFISVAEHSMMVANMMSWAGCSELNVAYGLAHDASEAYFTDVARPMKRQMPEYKLIESKLQEAIYQKLGLPIHTRPPTDDLKLYDNLALCIEAIAIGRQIDGDILEMMDEEGIDIYGTAEYFPVHFDPPNIAEQLWLEAWDKIAP